MRIGYAIALALLAFVAGALVTTALAAGGMPDMRGWSMAQMMDYCRGMMGP